MALSVGFVMQAKKLKSIDFAALAARAAGYGLRLVPVTLDARFGELDPLDVLVHKTTTTIAQADDGCPNAIKELRRLTAFMRQNPRMYVVDDLQSVRVLSNRVLTYDMLRNCLAPHAHLLLRAPTHAVIHSGDNAVRQIAEAGLRYPILCKSVAAHGSDAAHEMHIVFHDAGLADVPAPYVAQQFINHNAVIYKVFAVDTSYSVVVRPSIRNLTVTSQAKTIHFHSHDVSKAGSSSDLNEAGAVDCAPMAYNEDVLSEAVRTLRKCFNLVFFGFDVVVEAGTGVMYVVDVNYFPGYNGMDSFHDAVIGYLSRLNAARRAMALPAAEPAVSEEDASASSDSDAEMHLLDSPTRPRVYRAQGSVAASSAGGDVPAGLPVPDLCRAASAAASY